MTDITSMNIEAAIIDQKVAGEFRGKRYAFAPVAAKGRKIGEFWMLGVAVENEAGYSPIEGRYFADREEAREWADGLNRHIGHDIHSAFEIICSSIRQGPVPKPVEFGVWCEVSGGVTGFRQSWMKSDGVIRRFATREEAQAVVDAMQSRTRGNPHRTANFSYTVRTL